MAVPTPRKQLSLDANLVFDLAEERDFAHEFREVFLGRGYRLFLPPTALIELDFLSAEGGTSVERALARFCMNWPARPWRFGDSRPRTGRRPNGKHSRESGKHTRRGHRTTAGTGQQTPARRRSGKQALSDSSKVANKRQTRFFLRAGLYS